MILRTQDETIERDNQPQARQPTGRAQAVIAPWKGMAGTQGTVLCVLRGYGFYGNPPNTENCPLCPGGLAKDERGGAGARSHGGAAVIRGSRRAKDLIRNKAKGQSAKSQALMRHYAMEDNRPQESPMMP